MSQIELLTRFGDYLQYERRYSAHTVESYTRDVSQFTEFLSLQYGEGDLSKATHQYVRSWVVSLLNQKNQTVTIRRKLSSLAHMYKWMRRKDLLHHNPLQKVHLSKIPERLPKALTEGTIRKLWESFDHEPEETSYASLRDKTMIALLYGSGLRRSELINLKWTDVDADRRTLRILGKGRKHRLVPVGEGVIRLLSDLKKASEIYKESESSERVILTDSGKPCYPKFVHNKVVGLVGAVTTADKKSPHVLRHSMATHLMDHGAELNAVKEILGHSSLAATQVYTHNSIARLKEVYQLAHPASRSRK